VLASKQLEVDRMKMMERAKKAAPKEGAKFTAPDVRQFVPKELHDVVERITAAGVRFIYSPQAREQVEQDIASQKPTPQKLAESTLGLLLTLDGQTKGGLPADALFPAGLELLGEAAEILSAAGELVTQEDYNEAARMLFVMASKKLGMSDEDVMGVAEQAAAKAEGGQAGAPAAEAPPVDPEAEAQAAWDEEQAR
jgi:hypothetical protein